MSVIERSGQRVFIGSNGTDQGFNPPFGTSRAGILMSWGREQQPPWVGSAATPSLKACLMVDTPTADRSTLAMTLRGGVLPTAVLTAANLSKLWLDQGPGRAPRKLIDYDGGIFPPQYGQPYVLVSFDGETGKVFAVVPTKSRAGRAGEVPYGIEEKGDRVTLRGDFAGVYAAREEANVAPEGAVAVTIEAKTGRIVDLAR